RILKSADHRNAGYQLVQQREPLGPEFTDDLVEACQVASRSIEAGNEAELHRVSADTEHNWDAGGRSLTRESRRRPGCDDHGDLTLDEISRQRRQSFNLIPRPAVFDHKVAAFNIAGLTQTPPEAGQPGGVGLRRPEV